MVLMIVGSISFASFLSSLTFFCCHNKKGVVAIVVKLFSILGIVFFVVNVVVDVVVTNSGECVVAFGFLIRIRTMSLLFAFFVMIADDSFELLLLLSLSLSSLLLLLMFNDDDELIIVHNIDDGDADNGEMDGTEVTKNGKGDGTDVVIVVVVVMSAATIVSIIINRQMITNNRY